MVASPSDEENMRWRACTVAGKRLCSFSVLIMVAFLGVTGFLTWVYLSNAKPATTPTDESHITSPCGNWIPYKNDECIKFVDQAGTQTKKDADIICQALAKFGNEENVPQLITIKTKEKQEFLREMLFSNEATFDNVWLGLEMGKTGEFRWNDGTDLFYTNWAENDNSAPDRTCVQMVSGDAYGTGFWVKAGCKRRNAVVCEKTQASSVSSLQSNLLSLKLEVERNRRESEGKLAAAKMEANKMIIELNQKLAKMIKTSLKELERKINEAKNQSEKNINVVKQEADKLARENKDKGEAKINAVKQEAYKTIESYRKEAGQWLSTIKHETEVTIKNSTNSIVPIGFVYIQLPGQDAPSKIWPQATWVNVSAPYEGLFLRIKGGKSAPFGQIQEETSPRLALVEAQQADHTGATRILKIPANGDLSGFVYSGGLAGDISAKMRFQLSKEEVRPRNTAVIIWKRTG